MADPDTPSFEDAEAELEEDAKYDPLAKFRGEPVGTNDPNIVGDLGPLDTPPGADPVIVEDEEER